MKLKSLLLLALAAILTFAAPRPARALEVSFDFFFDALSPHGEWIEVGDYGYCWRPSGVDDEWAPYSDGYWTYTDAGWTWVSYEEFGGIVYHYGRWMRLEDEGWCWVPDYEWGPAWVSWRKSDDYVGWAPLPAEARWERERGLSVWVDTSYDIAPTSYSFCRFNDFGAPVLRPVIIRRSENLVIIHKTVNITNISYNSGAGCVFNGGLEYGYVNRYSRRQVPALKLVRNTNITVVNNHIVNNNVRVTNFNSVQQGNQLTIIAPTVVRPQPAQVAALLQPKVTKKFDQQKVTKGWGSVPADQRAAIRAKFQQEAAGKTPETAHAKPVKTEDLKVVPIKADPKAKMPLTSRKVPIALPMPGKDGEKKTPEAVTGIPTGTPPAVVTMPATPIDAAKTAREKASGRKPGKLVAPIPGVTQQTTEVPPVGKVIATPPPVAKERGKPVKPGIVKPFNPPVDDNQPAGNVRMTATPPPAEKMIATTPPPVVKERVAPVRPGIVKPFNPPVDDNQPTGTVRMTATPPPVNRTIEKNNAAAEAAKKQAAVNEAARKRVMEQNDQQQQEIARRKTTDAQEAAVARQRMLQQQQVEQKQQADAVTRKRAVDSAQMQQQQQQQQQILRDRAAQAAETKQRALQSQQAQAAAARQQAAANAQAQAAARRKAADMQVQPPRNVAPPVQQRNMPPPVQQRNVPPAVIPQQKIPVKPGKKPLTPEEAAAQQQLR